MKSLHPSSSDPLKPDTPVLGSPPAPQNSSVLEDAWERQQVYSKNASAAQKRFFCIRHWLIRLNIAATFLAILHAELGKFEVAEDPVQVLFQIPNPTFWGLPTEQIRQMALPLIEFALGWLPLINFFLILVPIIIAGLLAAAVKFDRGYNWLLLRGSAEALKMEIFYYRTRVGEYRGGKRDTALASKIRIIAERLKGSPVHQASLSPYEDEKVEERKPRKMQLWGGPKPQKADQSISRKKIIAIEPAKLTDLNAQQYLKTRLEDQFNFYRKNARKLDQDIQRSFGWIYVLGGIGTLLAAVGGGSWVALTTALTGAFVTYLETKRQEESLVGYNQAADALYSIRAWWNALSPEERSLPENFEQLVKSTESTIRSEHTSWLQDMQDRLAQLYNKDEPREQNQFQEGDRHPPSPSDVSETTAITTGERLEGEKHST